MTDIALITGATSGLGAEFAGQLAAQGYRLILVARDRDRLDSKAAELTDRFQVTAEVLAADLVSEAGRSLVEARLADAAQPVDLLVNNAGYGLVTPFHEGSVDDEQHHLDLLV